MTQYSSTQYSVLIALYTLVRKEITRFLRLWTQTLIPPIISTTLYFLIFGNLIGSRIGQMDGFSYIEYIAPGLIMMSVITSSYANVVSSFYGSRFQHFVEEMLVSPTPLAVILLGYVAGGVSRGLIVGFCVTLLTLFFTNLTVNNIGLTILTVVLTSILFALGGFLNGLFARSFDDIAIVPTFILTPLTYLGGVFYSIHLLPEWAQILSQLNPILYMVNAFRFGILGVSDISLTVALSLITIFIAALTWFCLHLLQQGRGIRN